MKVRAYKVSDIEAVANLFTASVHCLAEDFYNLAQRTAWAPKPPNLTEWHKSLNRLQTLIAEDIHDIAGFLSYESNGHVDLLYTSPLYVRHGVATMLYRKAEANIISTGVTELFTEASLVARPFFERQGFLVQEEQCVNRRGVSFRRYVMRKSIGRAQQGAAPDRYSATLHSGR